jgi:hypothetical protein
MVAHRTQLQADRAGFEARRARRAKREMARARIQARLRSIVTFPLSIFSKLRTKASTRASMTKRSQVVTTEAPLPQRFSERYSV